MRVQPEDLAAMAVYAQVVETRSFSAAARRIGCSKSSVSKAVSGLEGRLGARLINRTTRRLSLTQIGKEYYDCCIRMLTEAEKGETVVRRLQDEPRGLLRINGPTSYGRRHLAPALGKFLQTYPELQLDVTLNDRFVDLITEGYDVAIRIGKLLDSTLIARKLAPNRRVVCGSPDYLSRSGVPRHPGDLEAHNCLTYAYQATGSDWCFRGPDEQLHKVHVSGTLKANSGDVLQAAAIDGVGLVLSPTFSVWKDIASGALVPVMTDYVDAETAIYAVYPPARHISAKTRALVDFLAEKFGPEAYWESELVLAGTLPRITA